MIKSRGKVNKAVKARKVTKASRLSKVTKAPRTIVPEAVNRVQITDTVNFERESVPAIMNTVESAKPSDLRAQNTGDRKEFRFPHGYGDNRIVALVRDPWWIFSYWEIRRDKEEEVLRNIESAGDHRQKSVLRVYDVTDIHFNGKNARTFFDIDLSGLAHSWYINVGFPDRSWVVDIGIVTSRGDFYLLARSNVLKTPRFGMSDQLDAEWMMPEDEYWKMFSLSGGFGLGKSSGEVKEMVKRQLQEQLSSGALSSGASVFKKRSERKFWLVVNCELVVYGATEPDAKVTMQGKPMQLRPDGTFSVRFALPDGKQTIPVEAASSDGIDTRRITPIVTRKTE